VDFIAYPDIQPLHPLRKCKVFYENREYRGFRTDGNLHYRDIGMLVAWMRPPPNLWYIDTGLQETAAFLVKAEVNRPIL
jgi:hypothetical protein